MNTPTIQSPTTANSPAAAPRTDERTTTESDTPILAMDHVHYAYAKGGRSIVRDLNREFHERTVTAIVGPSGSGKTTTLSLLSGLTTPRRAVSSTAARIWPGSTGTDTAAMTSA